MYFTVDWRRGQEVFNCLQLSDKKYQKIDVILTSSQHSETQVELSHSANQLQGFRQSDDESVDLFMARCKIKTQECRRIV